MSTSYYFKVCRKADGKVLGKFNYDRIKSLNDIYAKDLSIDLDAIPYAVDSSHREFKFDAATIDHDISIVDARIEKLTNDLFTKKFLLVPNAKSAEVKNELEQDAIDMAEELENAKHAHTALAGLKIIVENITEGAIDVTKDDFSDNAIAYCYNAEGLPKTPEGYSPHIWVDDVDIFAYAC